MSTEFILCFCSHGLGVRESIAVAQELSDVEAKKLKSLLEDAKETLASIIAWQDDASVRNERMRALMIRNAARAMMQKIEKREEF